ncbi:helix-turn-helix domain-containing protein [Chitinophaga sp. CF418]|uniref:winged helix-turn-helix transcriptional regulator n=1 Tax=Chitinophaga sp. CF418 TaxID=1855287 RepID=UPI000916CC11|nr:helix-turn-helix domain-containing protein [Chitinophaga sp. CF418]SHN34151.1 transcriptional regulator, HxlR family [Chitinophaga sp. CF418]
MRKMYPNPKGCGVIRTVSYVGGKWKLLILLILIDKPVRFGKLFMLLSPISKKVLTQELRELEEDGLIIRHSYLEKPPRVEYELSDQGKKVLPVLDAMRALGDELKDIQPRSVKSHCYDATTSELSLN